MKIDLNAYCSCSHCGEKAGSYRSMGKYERELFPYESTNDFKLLCIECVKKELKLINSEIETHKETGSSGALLASLLNVYRKAFPNNNRSNH